MKTEDFFPMSLTGKRVCCATGAAALALFGGRSVSHARTGQSATAPAATAIHVPLVFSGGHDTDPRDRGRPVVFVAGALGVTSDVFRAAFSRVHPAPAGTQPDPDQVRQNKRALMDALVQYGVTDDRLNAVSNYYRYVRSRGEHWPSQPAEGYALVENGVVTGYVITSGGSGYSSPPTISVPGIADPAVVPKVQLAFSKTFEQNGSVSAIMVAGR